MTVVRRSGLVLIFMLAGCGSSHQARPTPHIAALVDGQTITRTELQQYIDYTIRFYSHIHAGSVSGLQCSVHPAPSPCVAVQKQVLARLIQEREVLHYATLHHIGLSASDRRYLQDEVDVMKAPDGGSTTLLSALGTGKRLLTRILERQLLVSKVEQIVAPKWTRRGPSFHIVRYSIPFTVSGGKTAAYKEGLNLATDGKQNARVKPGRKEWVAPFRLTRQQRIDLAVAQPGQFVGPYERGRTYVVIKLLRKAVHRYGRPANVVLVARFFRTWLSARLRAVRPQCFSASAARRGCPLPIH